MFKKSIFIVSLIMLIALIGCGEKPASSDALCGIIPGVGCNHGFGS